MTAERIRQIVARTNAVAPDATLLLGDFRRRPSSRALGLDRSATGVPARWLSLRAPLGVHAVLGNPTGGKIVRCRSAAQVS